MGDKIYLGSKNEYISSFRIHFGLTNNAYVSLIKRGIKIEYYIDNLVNQNVLLVRLEDKEREMVKILTKQNILVCALKRDGFTIIANYKNTPETQKEFLSGVLKIYCPGSYLSYSHQTDKGWETIKRPLSFSRGESIADENQMKEIFFKCIQAFNDSEDSNVGMPEEELVLGEEMGYLLDLAQAYVTTEDDFERTKAQSSYSTAYQKVETASGYDRVDKIAYKFYCNIIDFSIYKVGTRVTLTINNEDNDQVSGSITEFDELQKWIIILFDNRFNFHEMPSVGLFMVQHNEVQKKVREKVINDVKTIQTPAKYFYKIIENGESQGFQDIDFKKLDDKLKLKRYPPNESQINAIKKGIASNDILLVLGPPGTGKTTVIIEWVEYLVKVKKQRVLISSQNNKAVDNVLERINDSEIELIRIGSEEKVDSKILPFLPEVKGKKLQVDIENCSINTKSSCEKDIESILKAMEDLVKYEGLLKQYNSIQKQFSMVIGSINEKDRKAKEMYKQYLYLQQEMINIENKMNILRTKIQNYNSKSGIAKFFMSVTNILWNKRLNKYFCNHKKVTQDSNILLNNYNLINQEISSTISGNKFSSLKENKEKCFNEISRYKEYMSKGLEFCLPFDSIPFNFSEDFVQAIEDLNNTITKIKSVQEKVYILNTAFDSWLNILTEKRNDILISVLMNSVDVVGATCIGINSNKSFSDMKFDVTIIDEAGQIQIQNILVPMSRSPKVILLGDHKQIPPSAQEEVCERTVDGGYSDELLKKSFFQYLYEKASFPKENKILLDTQYRMPSEIAEILSGWFYKNNYKSFEGNRNLITQLPEMFQKPFVIITTSDSDEKKEEKEIIEKEKKTYNTYEASIIAKLIKVILNTVNPNSNEKKNFKPYDIGIISPYKYQVKVIRDELSKNCPEFERDEMSSIVATLDSYQGQERPIIIFSFVRSNDKEPDERRVGFLCELRRLNVALSRCQKQLILIGDTDFLSTCRYEPRDRVGNVIKEESEKRFSEFIVKILETAEKGNAQLINSCELLKIINLVK